MHSRVSVLAGQVVLVYLGLENSSPDRFFLHFQRWINIIWIVKCGLSGYGKKYEPKGYLRKVCPDRNRIRLRVNRTSVSVELRMK